MTYWQEFLTEAKSKRQQELEAKVAELDDVPASLKGSKKLKKEKGESEYAKVIKDIQSLKREKYEAQKKREIEKRKERAVASQQKEVERHKSSAGASLKNIKTNSISSNEKEGTAYSKLVGNVGSAAAGVAGAAYHGARALAAKRKLEQVKKKEFTSKQPEMREKKPIGRPAGAPKPVAAPAPVKTQQAQQQKQPTRTPERKQLIPATKKLTPATKRLPPAGGVPSGNRSGMTLGQRARRNPALKSALIKTRTEEYCNWREEFLWEVENGKYKKIKEKTIDIMKGKNKIEVNPITGDKNTINPMTGMRESISIEDAYGNTFARIIDIIGPRQMEPIVREGCWKGYKQIGMKKKGKKIVPNCVPANEEFVLEASPAWQRKAGKNPEGGLNKKGIESYRKENPGSKLSLAVTTEPSKLKTGSRPWKRRKSFCARMSGMPGPMKDEKGRPTRKALSLRKWNCN
jgi:hypothetical protein